MLINRSESHLSAARREAHRTRSGIPEWGGVGPP